MTDLTLECVCLYDRNTRTKVTDLRLQLIAARYMVPVKGTEVHGSVSGDWSPWRDCKVLSADW